MIKEVGVLFVDFDPTQPPGVAVDPPNVVVIFNDAVYLSNGPSPTDWALLSPGGGSSSSLIYRPGSGLSGPEVFNAWADVMTMLSKMRAGANGSGSYTILIDDSIVTPAPIPVGTYDMTDVILTGQPGKQTAVTVPDGVVLTQLRRITVNLQFTFTGATPPVSDFAATPFEVFMIDRGSSIVCTGTGPFLRNSSTLVLLTLLDGKIAFGATQVVDVNTAAAGTGVTVLGFNSAQLESDVLSGIAGSSAKLTWVSSSAQLSEDQPTFTGAGGTLARVNNTTGRRFPTAVITANTAIEPNVVARVDTTGGPVTITLPSADNHRGVTTIVKDVGNDAGANAITVLPTGGDTIDGGASATIAVNRGSLTFVSDGVSNWMIV